MDPAFEAFFGVLLLGLVLLAGIFFLSRPLWLRLWRYLTDWQRRDEADEDEELRTRLLRKEAEDELDRDCGSTEPGANEGQHEAN